MANSFPSSGGNRPGYFQRRNNDPFAHIRRNARIKEPEIRVISPEGKPPEYDGDQYFVRDGIIIVPKNAVIPDGTRI